MTDKPDHYQVLGVSKTATGAEIKAAHKKIMLQNHPDMIKNRMKGKSEAEIKAATAAADVTFKLANEAEKVLSDENMRAAYDKYGHKGVENLQTGKGASAGQSYEQAAGGFTRKTYSEDDLMDFFGKSQQRRENEEAQSGDDGLTSEQRRAKAREERLKRRGAPPEAAAPVAPPEKGSSANAFHVVAEKVNDAAQKLKDGVELPLGALEKFRENLADFLGEIDKAIAAKKRGPGPKFQS